MALSRLIVTQHGIPYQARASWGRSHRSSRRSDDLKGGTGKASRRATGDRGTARTVWRLREMRRGQRERSGNWRADYLETRTVGSEEGGGKRAARAVPRQPPILLETSVHKIRRFLRTDVSSSQYTQPYTVRAGRPVKNCGCTTGHSPRGRP